MEKRDINIEKVLKRAKAKIRKEKKKIKKIKIKKNQKKKEKLKVEKRINPKNKKLRNSNKLFN